MVEFSCTIHACFNVSINVPHFAELEINHVRHLTFLSIFHILLASSVHFNVMVSPSGFCSWVEWGLKGSFPKLEMKTRIKETTLGLFRDNVFFSSFDVTTVFEQKLPCFEKT